MKLFIAWLLLICVALLGWWLIPQFRVAVKAHAKGVAITLAGVTAILFVLFVAMSTSTWRLF